MNETVRKTIIDKMDTLQQQIKQDNHAIKRELPQLNEIQEKIDKLKFRITTCRTEWLELHQFLDENFGEYRELVLTEEDIIPDIEESTLKVYTDKEMVSAPRVPDDINIVVSNFNTE